jgi:predicted naringenin-chalcone synthase
MANAYINQIATSTPPFDMHQKFCDYGPRLLSDPRHKKLFKRMAKRTGITSRYSFLEPHDDAAILDTQEFYQEGHFPDTKARMKLYEANAFSLAKGAIDQLELGAITHVIVTSCTGFYAPGLDLQIVNHYSLPSTTERSMIGFMGCNAAFNALKLARHIARSEKASRVLVVNLELCTLHLKEAASLEEMLAFLIFADGCAASIVSNKETGLELSSFRSTLIEKSEELITWHIANSGFDMQLSGQVPATIAKSLPASVNDIIAPYSKDDFALWAIHPGGRTILNAVQEGAALEASQMSYSRDILQRYGNMSSATVMFVLKEMLANAAAQGIGCAMAFGPGLTVESMIFNKAQEHQS